MLIMSKCKIILCTSLINVFLSPSGVGEPPLCMSCSALFAIKRAIESARAEIGAEPVFVLGIYMYLRCLSVVRMPFLVTCWRVHRMLQCTGCIDMAIHYMCSYDLLLSRVQMDLLQWRLLNWLVWLTHPSFPSEATHQKLRLLYS